MPTLIEKIASKFNLMTRQQVEELLEKKSSDWGKLFEIGQEYRIFNEKVNRPYEQISNVYKAVKAIADNVPQADLKFYRKDGEEEITNDPIVNLFNRPNPFMTEADFIQALVGFYVLYGEAFIVKQQSAGQVAGIRNLPAELWVFNPADFREDIVYGTTQLLGWRYKSAYFKPEEVIHIKDFNPYSLFRGLKPTEPISKIIDIDWQTLIFNKMFFENDATPGIVLSTDQKLTDTQWKRLIEWWEKRFKGSSNAFKTAVLEAGLKPEQFGHTHKDMQFIDQKRFAREEILGIWRVPKALFNITEDLQYATFIGQMKIFWNYTIMPVLKKIEDTINVYITQPYNPNIKAIFDYSNVVAYQEDFKEKVDTAIKLFNMGFTANEINEKLELGFENKSWRDKWWIPFSLAPAGEAIEVEEEEPNEAKSKQLGENELKRLTLWRGFLKRQNALENKMASVIKGYFFTQRKEILENFMNNKTIEINWDEQDEKLKTKITPILMTAIEQGVEAGKDLLGKKDLQEDILNNKLRSYLIMRADKITQINRTIKNRLKQELEEGVTAGETIMQMADRIREVYNMASGRAIMIARTETTGAVNGGSFLYYQEVGVEKKQWLTARDEQVRERHQELEGETVLVSEKFSNGLDYPGDQSGEPEEVINCRCTLLPIFKGG